MMDTPLQPDGWLRIDLYEPVLDQKGVRDTTICFQFKEVKHWAPTMGFVHVVTKKGRLYFFNTKNVKHIEVQTNSDEYVNSSEAIVERFRDQLGMTE